MTTPLFVLFILFSPQIHPSHNPIIDSKIDKEKFFKNLDLVHGIIIIKNSLYLTTCLNLKIYRKKGVLLQIKKDGNILHNMTLFETSNKE